MDKMEERTRQRILDLANLADRRGIITYTDFMNLNELNIFHSTVGKIPFVRWKLFGGYAKAERQLAAHDILKERGAFENEKVKQSFDNKTLNLLVQSIDLQTNEASARELFDMLLQEGFRKIGIEDYENYYYSRNASYVL